MRLANSCDRYQIDMETLTDEVLMMLLGATESGDKFVVGSTPTTSYKLEATAKLVYADGHKAVKDIVIYNAVPQISDAINTSSTDLQTYTLTFDCSVDENGNFMEIKDHQ